MGNTCTMSSGSYEEIRALLFSHVLHQVSLPQTRAYTAQPCSCLHRLLLTTIENILTLPSPLPRKEPLRLECLVDCALSS